MFDLSILIPARNEMFLAETIKDILKNKRGKTEVITVLDGAWADPPIEDHPDVTVVYLPESVGQRKAQNIAARLSKAKYVMKVDAHCAFDEGFDVKLMEDMDDNWTVVPLMKNLHVFDWRCKKCGNRWYQGPEPEYCRTDEKGNIKNPECDSKEFERVMVWKPRSSPNSTSYRFNNQLEFKYWGDYKRKQEGDIVDTMSLQGSCFMATRENYWERELCDESWGSWGGQGAEVAIKTWLSGGEVKCNKKTWYAHLFRTQKGFSFPYSNPGNEQRSAKNKLRDTFLNDKWPKQKHNLEWLIDKFAPVPDWNMKRGVVYYSDNHVDKNILEVNG